MKKKDFIELARQMTSPGFYFTSYNEPERNRIVVECWFVDEIGPWKSIKLFSFVDTVWDKEKSKEKFQKKYAPYRRWLNEVQLERLMK